MAGFGQLGLQLVALRTGPVDVHDAGPFGEKRPHNRLTDALGTTGYQYRLAGEFQIHEPGRSGVRDGEANDRCEFLRE